MSDEVKIGPLYFEAWSTRNGNVAVQISREEELLSYLEWLTEEEWEEFKDAAR